MEEVTVHLLEDFDGHGVGGSEVWSCDSADAAVEGDDLVQAVDDHLVVLHHHVLYVVRAVVLHSHTVGTGLSAFFPFTELATGHSLTLMGTRHSLTLGTTGHSLNLGTTRHSLTLVGTRNSLTLRGGGGLGIP